MKYTLLTLSLLLTACNYGETELQPTPDINFSSVVEYSPAPGQFINDTRLAGFDGEATPEQARAYAEQRLRAQQYVSLGAWGGYLIVHFEVPIENDGGYNLRIEGNSMNTSSEPGVVWVMHDKNDNGKADDTWYELRGSEFDNSVRNYETTYTRPSADSDPIAWVDNKGGSGTIDRTKEHPQAYFPAWLGDTRTYKGTLLPKNVALKENLWIAQAFEWGYVDNYSTTGRNLFRIADAVDAAGDPASLPHISFVKIQSGVMDQGLLIGEISTEVVRINNYNLMK